MTVTYQVLNISEGGGSVNLLINPRGKINQLNESDGVLEPNQYFCDGWKAGAQGAEVYIDTDGFRLISGSIVQLVPNTVDIGRRLCGNLDIVSGSPAIRINGGTDNELAVEQSVIRFEVVGNNSKFTRLVLAESEELPAYQQVADELLPCKRFLHVADSEEVYSSAGGGNRYTSYYYPCEMYSTPAIEIPNFYSTSRVHSITKCKVLILGQNTSYTGFQGRIVVDARL